MPGHPSMARAIHGWPGSTVGPEQLPLTAIHICGRNSRHGACSRNLQTATLIFRTPAEKSLRLAIYRKREAYSRMKSLLTVVGEGSSPVKPPHTHSRVRAANFACDLSWGMLASIRSGLSFSLHTGIAVLTLPEAHPFYYRSPTSPIN